jgi:Ca-activated chloride channel homolog
MRALVPLLVLVAGLSASRPALAWELFRSESSTVDRGNEHLAKKQYKEALEAYDRAARELPDDPGVQLNRGLALQALGKLGDAREAFRRAGSGDAPPDVRGAALYNLGSTFMQEADQAGKAEDFDGAKKMLTEASDAFKGSLRAQPGNPNAAWNLELAKRRIVDVEKKQEEKKKQEEEQKKDQQDKDKQNQQDGGTPEQNDGGQDGDGGSDKPEQQDGGAQPEGEPDAGAPDAGGPQPDPADQADGGQADAGAEPQPQPSEPDKQENALPEHMKRALDALEAGEENLEKQRAMQRARQRPRRIEKDW